MTHRELEHAELQVRRAEAGRPSVELLRSETFELGLYELADGSEDGQKPHDEDEVYAVHRFHSIDEDLSIVVAFSPPGSR